MGAVARRRAGERLWWIGVAAFTVVGLLFGWFGVALWSTPEDGTDSAGMAAVSAMMFFFLSLGSLDSAFTCAVALILVRRQSSEHGNNVATPAWYPDPWGVANRRWWDGHSWTGWTG
jgi:hypothetical protein